LRICGAQDLMSAKLMVVAFFFGLQPFCLVHNRFGKGVRQAVYKRLELSKITKYIEIIRLNMVNQFQ